MFRRLSRASAWLLALVLSACGGGGGGGGTAAALSFSPSTLHAETDPGTSASVSVNVTPNIAPLGTTLYIYVIDTAGVITPQIVLERQPNGSYQATVTTSSSLAAGHYTGSFDVRVCATADCSQEYPGSPVHLPYDFQIGVVPNLTPLAAVAGLGDWETLQRNAAHTGYVPLTLDASKFTTRWRWVGAEWLMTVSPPVAANDAVLFSYSGYSATSQRLYSLNEQDGSVRWMHDFGSVFAVNPPAVSGDAVYVATSGHSDTALWSFAAADGSQRFSTPFNSQWDYYDAPIVSGGAVYNNGGYYGGLLRFEAATGQQDWFAQYWAARTPAVGASLAYVNTGGIVHAFDEATGADAFSFTFATSSFADTHAVPVLVDEGRLLARSTSDSQYNTLALVDTASKAVLWSASGYFATDPVVANNVVYVASNSPLRVEARSQSTGGLLWSWSLPDTSATGFTNNLVVTDSLLFVSSNRQTYALDLNSHAQVWSYAKSGHKAISRNGVLYIATRAEDGSSDRGLTAVNLR
jgi:outer membrane protein assembly factor BamB